MIVEKYASLSRDERLIELLADKHQLQQYAQTTPLPDMIRQAPADLDAEQLVALLRPLTPRLYSIASAQEEVGNEVHITVGVVRYDVEGRARTGGASGYLADRLEEEGELRVFIEHNDNFRLPANPQTPVIMIGPGTGIAPFRAFIQQRAAEGAEGLNWLFFGNPHFTEDFLYQVEWQRYVKEGFYPVSIWRGHAIKITKSMFKTNCVNKVQKCGAGLKRAHIFTSAETPTAWRKTLNRRYWSYWLNTVVWTPNKPMNF